MGLHVQHTVKCLSRLDATCDPLGGSSSRDMNLCILCRASKWPGCVAGELECLKAFHISSPASCQWWNLVSHFNIKSADYSTAKSSTFSFILISEALIHFPTQACDPINCYRKPVERTSEISLEMISLVRSTGFPQQLIGWLSQKVDQGLHTCWTKGAFTKLVPLIYHLAVVQTEP